MTYTADDIVSAARSCIGTKFVHQGRAPGVGLDCAGVVSHVIDSLGYAHDGPAAYGRLPFAGMLEQVLDRQEYLRKVTDMQAGDVMLMRFVGDPQHLGVCAGETMIHAYLQAGRCVEHQIDRTWRNRVVSVYRFEGVA